MRKVTVIHLPDPLLFPQVRGCRISEEMVLDTEEQEYQPQQQPVFLDMPITCLLQGSFPLLFHEKGIVGESILFHMLMKSFLRPHFEHSDWFKDGQIAKLNQLNPSMGFTLYAF